MADYIIRRNSVQGEEVERAINTPFNCTGVIVASLQRVP